MGEAGEMSSAVQLAVGPASLQDRLCSDLKVLAGLESTLGNILQKRIILHGDIPWFWSMFLGISEQ